MNRNTKSGQPERPAHQSQTHESDAIALAEETVGVDKREVVTGRVRVRTVTNEREEPVRQELARESVEVTRVPVDREVDRPPETRQEGDVTIIPVVEEVLVVETRLVLKEEIHIRRTRSVESFETPVVLRRQEAVIERLDADGNALPKETST